MDKEKTTTQTTGAQSEATTTTESTSDRENDNTSTRDINIRVYDACKKGDESTVRSLIANVPDINWHNPEDDNWTFLHASSFKGHLLIVKLLFKYNANIKSKDKYNWTVLHTACCSDNLDLIKLIVQLDATLLTEKDVDDETVLHIACQFSSCAVVKFLVEEKGMSLQDKDKNKDTVLHYACFGGNLAVIKLLVHMDATLLTEKNINDSTVLHAACQDSGVDVVKFFVEEKELSVQDKDKDGWTCLHFACYGGRWEVVDYCLKKGLSIHETDKDGDTPLSILKERDDYDNVETMKRKQECLQQLKANGYLDDETDLTNQLSNSQVNTTEPNQPTETDTGGKDTSDEVRKKTQSISDFRPFLRKAAAKGTVKTRRTNFGLTGASGTGKTSTLRLLVDEEPISEHHSTPVLKPIEYFNECEECDSDNDEREDEEGSSDLDTDSQHSDSEEPHPEDSQSPEPTKAEQCASPPKRYMMIASGKGNKWKPATQDALMHRLANCVVRVAESQESVGTRKRNKMGALSLMMKGGFFAHRLGSLTDAENTKNTSEEKGATDTIQATAKSFSKMSFEDLEATREILNFIDSHQNLKDLGITHFVNVTDTGGQAAFMDIAPALMRFSSVNLVLIRLDEELNSLVKYFYSVRGKVVGCEKRQVTTKSLVYSALSSKCKIQSPSNIQGMQVEKGHDQSMFMIVGTHLDKYQEMINRIESLSDKEKELKKFLQEFENFILMNGDKLIFSLNALSRDHKTKKLASTIRKLAMQYYVEAEVPVCWYIFQVAISQIKVTSTNRNTIPISKFVEIGRVITMPEDEVRAALQYFHEMSIVLYYPAVLPNVVFTTPQFLLDKISEIIGISLGNCDPGVTLGEKKRLQERGLFKKSLLKHVSKGFDQDLFTSDDFLQLMTHLFIISQLPNTDEYFIPCVLETANNPFADLPGSSIPVEPLLFTWNETVPNGLFPSLMASMQSIVTNEHVRFEMSPVAKQYRNRISFNCPKLACVVTLIECNSFIAVATSCEVREHCAKVRSAVLSGIDAVVKRFDWMPLVAYPEEAFLCQTAKCRSQCTNHLCYSDVTMKVLSCSLDSSVTTKQTDSHSIWANGTGISSVPAEITVSNMFNLLRDKASHWDEIGREFKVSMDFRKGLDKDRSLSNDARLERVIHEWVESTPPPDVSWSAFMSVLTDSLGYNDVARRTQTFLRGND